MEIYVVRHGQTDWNIQDKLQGHTNVPLNKTGIEQAYKIKENLSNINFSKIYCSPLERCIKTAEIINKDNLPIIIDDRLIERNFGNLEGKQGHNIEDFMIFEKNLDSFNVEPIQSFFKRVHAFLEDITSSANNDKILLVTHNGVNVAINCFFNPELTNTNLKLLNIRNCDYKKYIINKEIDNEKQTNFLNNNSCI